MITVVCAQNQNGTRIRCSVLVWAGGWVTPNLFCCFLCIAKLFLVVPCFSRFCFAKKRGRSHMSLRCKRCKDVGRRAGDTLHILSKSNGIAIIYNADRVADRDVGTRLKDARACVYVWWSEWLSASASTCVRSYILLKWTLVLHWYLDNILLYNYNNLLE